MIKEFKEFINRGNVLDLAVGVIIGGAFGAITKSLVDDILMPLIGILLGGVDFKELFIPLDGKTYASLAQATEEGGAVLRYGVFINAVVMFFLISLVLFFIVRAFNHLHRKEEEAPVAPTTKICSYCKTEIAKDATRCPHCTSTLDE